jgi:sugar phosphate isomerase/epimerase
MATPSSRRAFLKSAPLLAAGAYLGRNALAAPRQTPQAAPARTPKRNPIGVSTYSFGTYQGRRRLDEIEILDIAADMGFDGVELLQNAMRDQSPSKLQRIKTHAHSVGLALMGLSTHQDFVHGDPAERQKNVELTIRQIEFAARLGIPTIRINTGRWNTIGSFDLLMSNKGVEPVSFGHTEDEGFQWVIDAITKLLPAAETNGVILGLENHWGLARTAAGLLRIVEAVNSPWLQITFDTGNFFEQRVEQLKMMAASKVPICLVQAKTYYGGGTWYTLDIDYAEIAGILRGDNYRGWISLEFEGREDASTGVPKSLALLRQHFS